jgi:hypothetical protein
MKGGERVLPSIEGTLGSRARLFSSDQMGKHTGYASRVYPNMNPRTILLTRSFTLHA